MATYVGVVCFSVCSLGCTLFCFGGNVYEYTNKGNICEGIGESIITILDRRDFDFAEYFKEETESIASEVQEILLKYGFDSEHECDEATDFMAIEEIVNIYEKHGYDGGTIHNFG